MCLKTCTHIAMHLHIPPTLLFVLPTRSCLHSHLTVNQTLFMMCALCICCVHCVYAVCIVYMLRALCICWVHCVYIVCIVYMFFASCMSCVYCVYIVYNRYLSGVNIAYLAFLKKAMISAYFTSEHCLFSESNIFRL